MSALYKIRTPRSSELPVLGVLNVEHMLPVSQQHQLVSVINEREDHRPFCKPKCLEQPPTKLGPTAQPAPRAEVAVLFLLQEAPILLRAKRGEFFFRESKKFGDQLAYYSSCRKCAFGAIFRLRAKFSKKPATKLGTTAQPAPRAEGRQQGGGGVRK